MAQKISDLDIGNTNIQLQIPKKISKVAKSKITVPNFNRTSDGDVHSPSGVRLEN